MQTNKHIVEHMAVHNAELGSWAAKSQCGPDAFFHWLLLHLHEEDEDYGMDGICGDENPITAVVKASLPYDLVCITTK